MPETKQAMTIESVYIQMEDYGPDKGKLKGHIALKGMYGKVEVRLNNDKAGKIMSILADEIVSAAQETANMLRQTVLDQVEASVALPAPASDITDAEPKT